MVYYVSKRGLKAKPQVLVQLENLRQSRVHCRSSRTFQAAHARVADATCSRRRRRKRRDVEVISVGAMSRNRVPDPVRTNHIYACSGRIGIGLVLAHAHGRR
jgi:hypothetical protein